MPELLSEDSRVTSRLHIYQRTPDLTADKLKMRCVVSLSICYCQRKLIKAVLVTASDWEMRTDCIWVIVPNRWFSLSWRFPGKRGCKWRTSASSRNTKPSSSKARKMDGRPGTCRWRWAAEASLGGRSREPSDCWGSEGWLGSSW